MKISVVIPCYEMHNVGSYFLEQSFLMLKRQKYRDFEVIVGDQSNNAAIANLVEKWKPHFEIKRISNFSTRGNPSANLNSTVRASTGEIVKILFQDDLLTRDDALERVANGFIANPSKNWLVNSFEHTRDGIFGWRPFVPTLQNRLKYGVNTFGPPSTISVRRHCYLDFDPNLSWMMDLETYSRMLEVLGDPIIDNEICIASREWGMQNTHNIADLQKISEELYSLAPKIMETDPQEMRAIYLSQSYTHGFYMDLERTRQAQSDCWNLPKKQSLARLRDLTPISFDVLLKTIGLAVSPKDKSFADAVALLVGYHTSEQTCVEIFNQIDALSFDEIDPKLHGLKRYIARDCLNLFFPTNYLPKFFEDTCLHIQAKNLDALAHIYALRHFSISATDCLETSKAKFINKIQEFLSHTSGAINLSFTTPKVKITLVRSLKKFENLIVNDIQKLDNEQIAQHIIVGTSTKEIELEATKIRKIVPKLGFLIRLNLYGDEIIGPHSHVLHRNYFISLEQIF